MTGSQKKKKYLSRNLLFCQQEVTSPIKLKLFNTLFNFLFEGNEKIAWNMNFVSIKAKKNKNDKMIFCQTRRTHQNRNEHDSCKSEPLCNSPILEGSKITNEELMDTSVSHRWPQVWVFWSF